MVNRAIIENLIKLKCMIDIHTPQRMLVFDSHSAYDMVISLDAAIEALSADRKGYWIDTYGDEWVCSNCGVATHASEDYHSNDDRAYKMNFCHYCGAYMGGEQNYERDYP